MIALLQYFGGAHRVVSSGFMREWPHHACTASFVGAQHVDRTKGYVGKPQGQSARHCARFIEKFTGLSVSVDLRGMKHESAKKSTGTLTAMQTSQMTHFGSWSTTLALGALFGTVIAMLLASTPQNTASNRLLAALLLLIVLKLCPYILGFAGYYDAYPWLSFAPLGLGLGFGPLLYLHVRRLTSACMPRRWGVHLLPAALQFCYGAVLFMQPLAFKNQWNSRVHARWVDPLETALELASMAIYLWLAVRAYRAYQVWLDAHLSNREEFRLAWLRNVLAAFALLWPMWAIYEALSAGFGFDYFQRFPLYLGFTALVFYLGVEGWRHADCRYPVADIGSDADSRTRVRQDAQDEAAPDRFDGAHGPSIDTALPPRTPPDRELASRDWHAQGTHWLQQTFDAGWWRDPDLGLDSLARNLGTNTSYLSRALNEGLGQSFNDAINRLRVEDVQRQLAAGSPPRDLLAIAFDAGFSSKSSFNRVFKIQTGQTPSRYREMQAIARPIG